MIRGGEMAKFTIFTTPPPGLKTKNSELVETCEADYMEIIDGCLAFADLTQLVKVYASGEWTYVSRDEEALADDPS